MALELKQNLKLTQQLVMTPQLQQAIKLLQLSRLELIETINQELEANPLLEEATTADLEKNTRGDEQGQEDWADSEAVPGLAATEAEKTPWEKDAIKDTNWQEVWDDEYRRSLPSYSFEEKEVPNYENIVASKSDLKDHLTWQLQLSDMSEEDRKIASLIIGNLDKDGYLKATVEEIAEDSGTDVEHVERVLKKVQEFDPVGVAARDLRECLLIQIDHLGIEDPLVKELVSKHLHQVELHNYQQIAKATGRKPEDVVKAIEVIKSLEPKPGRAYSSEEVQYIVPDIYVYKVGDEYVVALNEEDLPNLRINPVYKDAAKNGDVPQDAKEFIQEKMKSALWLIKSIHQRKKTIYKVTQSIVKFQREFLDKGIAYLKPMVLKDVAEDVGMHESTISRVTSNKYVHTPQGIFELKFFFSTGLTRKDGSKDVAAQSVKERIRRLIENEDPTKPFSDKQIVEILAKDNIKIARRTVAKYRDLMGILPSSRRKRPKI
ncbi:MAG: RNA polymerase factor sigma-54 [Thermodesulfobacteria bacterium]|nr:RNA polymerase factor sigma-54 [Thermodesulfobacteriota bacterium]